LKPNPFLKKPGDKKMPTQEIVINSTPKTLSVRRWRKRILIAASLGVAFWLFASWIVVDQLTRRPHPLRLEPLPSAPWGAAETIRLTASDNQDLGAWYFAARKTYPAVLLLHGNGGSRADCLDQAEWLVAAGHPVFLVTLRAHGDSTGDRNDFGYSARHDVIAAVEWLEANGHPPTVVWGRSLGSAAALFAAGELGDRAAGYILECPYRDLRTSVRNRTRERLPLVLDWLAYSGLALTAPFVLDDVDRISPLAAAASGSAQHAGPDPRRTQGLARDSRRERDEIACCGSAQRAEVVVFETAGHLGLHRADPAPLPNDLGLRFLADCQER
jgi:uncharacterized protein